MAEYAVVFQKEKTLHFESEVPPGSAPDHCEFGKGTNLFWSLVCLSVKSRENDKSPVSLIGDCSDE